MAEDAADVAAEAILAEYRKARKKHAPMHSGHEGYAVIREELDELWDEVKQQSPDPSRLMNEAMQVGAMALAFMVEVAAAQPKEEHDGLPRA